MRINSKSITELNANRNLGSTANMLGESLEKLSSGYRINRAGDGVAVLVISQNVRVDGGDLDRITRKGQGCLDLLQAIGS